MKEAIIRYSSREAHDRPKEPIVLERLLQIYGRDDLKKFVGFVRGLQRENKSRFCVSRKDNWKIKDPDLLFYEIGDAKEGKFPQIIYLGRMMGKGSIEITSRFAAESHGYSVLKLAEKN